MFRKVLIANRGEIAVRVIRACRELGVQSVAVYSDADADALHVRMADEAVHLGPAPSTESYLVQEKILDAAKSTGAEAIHPGYGFLSENAGFVAKCEDAGIKFIGPGSKAMAAMGDKVSAKEYAVKAGVPVAPSSEGEVEDPAKARELVEQIGLPVIVKAVHGGGGMGMRIVRAMDELDAAIEGASTQAASAFGSGAVFIEKFIENPRHIEFQVLGDEHGHAIHLGERECSIQRRNQKLLEEAPSPVITEEQRRDLGARCAKLVETVGYAGAGTMEFLFKDGEFFFMEMNTRLQVEHPVTELVTGVDLVKWQLRIASGEKLTLQQDDIVLRGHALELRLNAEDPFNGFAPAPGHVTRWDRPAGPGVRVDDGLREGWTIPSTYDSLVAKLITYADDRLGTIDRSLRALDEMVLKGELKTNVPFHRLVLNDEAFRKGDMTTGFIEERNVVARLMEEHDRVLAGKRRRVVAVAAALTRAPGGGVRGVYHRQNVKLVPQEGSGESRLSPWARSARPGRGF